MAYPPCRLELIEEIIRNKYSQQMDEEELKKKIQRAKEYWCKETASLHGAALFRKTESEEKTSKTSGSCIIESALKFNDIECINDKNVDHCRDKSTPLNEGNVIKTLPLIDVNIDINMMEKLSDDVLIYITSMLTVETMMRFVLSSKRIHHLIANNKHLTRYFMVKYYQHKARAIRKEIEDKFPILCKGCLQTLGLLNEWKFVYIKTRMCYNHFCSKWCDYGEHITDITTYCPFDSYGIVYVTEECCCNGVETVIFNKLISFNKYVKPMMKLFKSHSILFINKLSEMNVHPGPANIPLEWKSLINCFVKKNPIRLYTDK